MFLKKISLTNFRNYHSQEIEFKKLVTIFLGDNAQGKSNILESIYFLSTTKSPKADKDEDLIYKNEQVLRIDGIVEKNSEEVVQLNIVMQLLDNFLSKKVRVNGIPRRVVDYIGNLSVVYFTPEDINLVTGPPALRRWHIDLTLAQIDKEYKRSLTAYSDVVTSKNRILKKIKEGFGKIDELDFWIEKQLELGEIISRKRRDFFRFLNEIEGKKFGNFNYKYQESILTKNRLEEYLNKEIASASSLIGPHRDDFIFLENSNPKEPRDLSSFGSRGEQRTAVLDLKISEVEFIESVTNSRPVLLLDDVFSELDISHKKHVLNIISLQQTILAGVNLEEEIISSLKDLNLYRVENGQLTEIAGK